MATDQPPGFAIAAEERDGVMHVVPRGELDIATAPALEQDLDARLHDGAPVVLDLRELAFMDSSGVRALVAAHRLADQRGVRLQIVRPSRESPVDRVIAISGIAENLGMVDAQ